MAGIVADGIRVRARVSSPQLVPAARPRRKQEYGAHTLRINAALLRSSSFGSALKIGNGPGSARPWTGSGHTEAGAPGSEASVSGQKRAARRASRDEPLSRKGARRFSGHASIRRRPASRGFLPFHSQLSAQRWPRGVALRLRGRVVSWNARVAGAFGHNTACKPAYDGSRGSAWARRRSTGTAATGASTSPRTARIRAHTPALNAAQRGLLRFGTMHGYLSMYWARNSGVERVTAGGIRDGRLSQRPYQLDGRTQRLRRNRLEHRGSARRHWAERRCSA